MRASSAGKQSLRSSDLKKTPRVNSLANIFLTLGLIGTVFSGYLIFQRYNPQKLAFNADLPLIQQVETNSHAVPAVINIESQKITLPIITSEIKDNRWEATTQGVSYLKSSVIPGEKGNSILYGHNWPNLLGNLNKVKPGERIKINFSDNTYKEFLIEYIAQVNPDQTSILDNSTDNRLTLYTCSGFLDRQRLVVVAKLLV